MTSPSALGVLKGATMATPTAPRGVEGRHHGDAYSARGVEGRHHDDAFSAGGDAYSAAWLTDVSIDDLLAGTGHLSGNFRKSRIARGSAWRAAR